MQAHVLNVLNGEMGDLCVMGIVNGRMENVLEISLLGSVFQIQLLEMGSVTIKPIMLAAATMAVIAVCMLTQATVLNVIVKLRNFVRLDFILGSEMVNAMMKQILWSTITMAETVVGHVFLKDCVQNVFAWEISQIMEFIIL